MRVFDLLALALVALPMSADAQEITLAGPHGISCSNIYRGDRTSIVNAKKAIHQLQTNHPGQTVQLSDAIGEFTIACFKGSRITVVGGAGSGGPITATHKEVGDLAAYFMQHSPGADCRDANVVSGAVWHTRPNSGGDGLTVRVKKTAGNTQACGSQ